MSAIVMQTDNLRKHFGDFVAVDGINMPVYSGEVFGFLGPNGAGKTTTIGMMLGLVHATTGSVEIFGERVTPSNVDALRKVGSLIGAPAFLPYFSAEKNLKVIAKMYPGIDQKRIDEVLEIVGLDHAAKRKAKGYSTGMKQRLGLAAALLHKPKLIILDEPTSGLDPNGMRDFRQLLRRLADDGTTVFLSSHLLNEVQQICDRVAVLNQGRIVAQGTVGELLTGQDGVQVKVKDVPSAETILRQLPTVTVNVSGDYLEVVGGSAETVVSTLTTAGIIPSEIKQIGNSLEDLFVNLTQPA